MTFKDTLKEKVPEHLKQTPEWPVLLRIVEKENFANVFAFKHFLEAEIQKKEDWLKQLAKDKSSTNNRLRVEAGKELDFLRMLQDKILPYVL